MAADFKEIEDGEIRHIQTMRNNYLGLLYLDQVDLRIIGDKGKTDRHSKLNLLYVDYSGAEKLRYAVKLTEDNGIPKRKYEPVRSDDNLDWRVSENIEEQQKNESGVRFSDNEWLEELRALETDIFPNPFPVFVTNDEGDVVSAPGVHERAGGFLTGHFTKIFYEVPPAARAASVVRYYAQKENMYNYIHYTIAVPSDEAEELANSFDPPLTVLDKQYEVQEVNGTKRTVAILTNVDYKTD